MQKPKIIAILCALAMTWVFPPTAISGSLYHATTKAFARRIMAKGINPAKFNRNARFGKMFYTAKRPSTALAEKGPGSTVVRMKPSKSITKNSWDLRNPTAKRIRKLVGNADLRGTMKRGMIGPKLGRKIGKLANKKQKSIFYQSAKNGKTNVAVPASMIAKHPRTLYGKAIYQQ